MLALNEMQFELLETEDSAVGGFGFGIGLDVEVDDEGFDPGEATFLDQDGTNPDRGTTMFGVDAPAAETWTWQMHVNRDTTANALATLAALRVAWRARKVVTANGAVSTLRYRVGDRVRRVYGRPRRFAAPPSNRILGGYVPVTASFKKADDLHYDDVEQSVACVWSATDDGGFNLPDIMPLHSLPDGTGEGTLTVGGDAPTYPIVTFAGPVANPVILLDNWALGLNLGLAAGDTVVIDTRPWHLTATLNGTTSVVGSLNRRQYMKNAVLEPGTHNYEFDGLSSAGGATCTISWRDAYTSL